MTDKLSAYAGNAAYTGPERLAYTTLGLTKVLHGDKRMLQGCAMVLIVCDQHKHDFAIRGGVALLTNTEGLDCLTGQGIHIDPASARTA